jgi:hypothetical protein
LPSLTGIFNADPMLRFSGLGYGALPGLLPGLPLIDPSIGTVHQSLGHLAISDLLHGHMPFWDPYRGAGLALLGEMNGSPFYPLMAVLLLPRGQVIMEVLVQILSGLATFGVLRSLGLGVLPAATGGLLFEFNGTMAWLGGGWNYPSPCLPLLIYGIEKLRGTTIRARALAIAIMTLAIAISISAGFVEISFLNGLLAGAWAAYRWSRTPRAAQLAMAAGLALSAVAGSLLASPIIIAFFDNLGIGDVGGNHSGVSAWFHLPTSALLQKFAPYTWGPIFYYKYDPWGQTGGYLGFVVPIVALAALFGCRDRGLRWVLIGWVAVAMGSTFGFRPFQALLLLVPGVRFTASYRYLDMSCAFALAVLVAFCIDDARTIAWTELRRRLLVGAFVVVVAFLVCFWASTGTILELRSGPGYNSWLVGSLIAAYVLGAAAILCGRAPDSTRALLLAGTVVVEAVVAFSIPTLATPRGGSLALGGVDFLRKHLGFERFYSTGPMALNYSALFRLGSIDYLDLPTPYLWINYVRRRLDPFADPRQFFGAPRSSPEIPDVLAELGTKLAGYEDTGVKYVVTPPSVRLSTVPTARLVYRDIALSIFELPLPAPYVSASGCALTPFSRLSIRGWCNGPSTLRRLELNLPGWAATVNGEPASIASFDDAFQQVRLPFGSVDVHFAFVPPHMVFGYAGFSVGVLLLAGLLIVAYRPAQRFAGPLVVHDEVDAAHLDAGA